MQWEIAETVYLSLDLLRPNRYINELLKGLHSAITFGEELT